MTRNILSLLFLLLSYPLASPLPSPLPLSASNFTETLSAPPSFVLFYAPWCGRCARFRHTFKDLAEWADGGDEEVAFYEVDATKETDLKEKYNVVNFPTLLYFTKASTSEFKVYKGPREEKRLQHFLTIQSIRANEGLPFPINDKASYDDFQELNDRSDVILKTSKRNYIKAWEKGADEITFGDELLLPLDLVVGWIGDDSFSSASSCTDCLIVTNHETGKTVTSPLPPSPSSLVPLAVNLAIHHAAPSYTTLIPYTTDLFSRARDGSSICKFASVFSKEFKLDSILPLLPPPMAHPDVATVWVDPVSHPDLVLRYRLNATSEGGLSSPSLMFFDVCGGPGTMVSRRLDLSVSPPSPSVSASYSGCFLDDPLALKTACPAAPWAASDVPRNGYTTQVPMMRLVGRTINGRILTSDKDQFVLFYSEADKGYIRAYEEFKAVAGRFYMEDSVEFYLFEVDENDVPMKVLDLSTTPVLYLFPAGKKSSPIAYKKKFFTSEEIMKWLRGKVETCFTSFIDGRQACVWWKRPGYNLALIKEKGLKAWWNGEAEEL